MTEPLVAQNDPFEAAIERRTPGPSNLLVPVSWAMAGFAVAVCGSIAVAALGGPDWIPPLAAALGGGAGGMIGLGVARIERWQALERPAVVDPRGRSRRPVHAAAHLIPAAIGTAALVGLGGILAFAGETPWAVGACLAVGLGSLALVRKLLGEHALARALEAAEAEEPLDASRRLERLAGAWWAPRVVRDGARVNLGMLALTRGDIEGARRALVVTAGPAGAWASAGRAMLLLLDGDLAAAEVELLDVVTGPYARFLQPQTDAVRLLLVLRREGDVAARALGEHLIAPGATPLFVGLLADLRRRGGDEAGARALLDPSTVGSLRALGLSREIPELRALLAA